MHEQEEKTTGSLVEQLHPTLRQWNHGSNANWLRVNGSRICPICSHPDWCLISKDGSAAICPRTSEGAVRLAGEGGWLHRLSGSAWSPSRIRTRTIAMAPPIDMAPLALAHQAAVPMADLELFARGLGVTPDALRRLHVGWDGEAWTFPMQDAAGRVIGIRRRLPSGRKLAVRGGREGLFVPEGLANGCTLFIAEGPTDTAALLDLGFTTLGRPSCSGGTRHVVGLVRSLAPVSVVIVADADESGQRGASALASTLTLYCRDVRLITPPSPHKDARAWKQAGATRQNIEQLIKAAPARLLPVRCRKAGV